MTRHEALTQLFVESQFDDDQGEYLAQVTTEDLDSYMKHEYGKHLEEMLQEIKVSNQKSERRIT